MNVSQSAIEEVVRTLTQADVEGHEAVYGSVSPIEDTEVPTPMDTEEMAHKGSQEAIEPFGLENTAWVRTYDIVYKPRCPVNGYLSRIHPDTGVEIPYEWDAVLEML